MEVFASILYYPIGWFYLWLKYRNKKKIKAILKEKYEGEYYFAGAQLVWSTFGIVLFVLLSLFLIVVIGKAIYNLFD